MRRLALILVVSSLLATFVFGVRKVNIPSAEASSPIYQGDLILKGNNVTTIEGRFDINGSIIVEENATLYLKNAFLNITQSEGREYNITLRNALTGNPRLLVYNSTVTSPNAYYTTLYVKDNSTATIYNSTLSRTHAEVRDDSTLSISSSSYLPTLYGFDASIINIHDSKIYLSAIFYSPQFRAIDSEITQLSFSSSSINTTISDLESGLIGYWNFATNCSVDILPGGYTPDLTLINTKIAAWSFSFSGFSSALINHVTGWDLRAYRSSVITVTNSTFGHLMASGSSVVLFVNSTCLDIDYILDEAKINVAWYLDVRVTDAIGRSVPFANVTASYPNATIAKTRVTNVSGWTRLMIEEKMINATGTYPVGNHTVTAAYRSYSANASINMTENKQIILKLVDLHPPTIIIPNETLINQSTGTEKFYVYNLSSAMFVQIIMDPEDSVDYDLTCIWEKEAWTSPDNSTEHESIGVTETCQNLLREGSYHVKVDYVPPWPGTYNLTLRAYPVSTVHNINAGLNYSSIQEAINAPETTNGHTIRVDSGFFAFNDPLLYVPVTYFENIVVNKSLTLIGANKSTTIIDGNHSGIVINITANAVTITNFTVRNSGSWWPESGIALYKANYSTVTQNIITHNDIGIRLYQSSDNIVSENNIRSNNDEGVYIDDSSGNLISRNNITNNREGIKIVWSTDSKVVENNLLNNNGSMLPCGVRIENSKNGSVIGNFASYNGYLGIFIFNSVSFSLRDNIMTNNRYNFGLTGQNLSHFLNDIDLSNIVEGKPVYFLINQRNLLINPTTFANIGYLALVNSTNITVKNLSMKKNRNGVMFAYTTNSTIENIDVSENSFGIELRYSPDNSVLGNYVNDIMHEGILLHESNNVNISSNHMYNSRYGLYVSRSNETSIDSNYISNGLYGIRVYGSAETSIDSNYINNCSGGVYISRAVKSNVTANTFVQPDGYVLTLRYSHNNTFYHNVFICNTLVFHIYPDSYNNAWDNGVEGNYWSNYRTRYPNAAERDNSGTWNTPYVIDENNQDNYPLVEPYPHPSTMIKTLLRTIKLWNLRSGTENSLKSKLEKTLRLLDMQKKFSTVHKLLAFVNHVEVLRGKKMTNVQADYLISEAQRIIDLIKG